MRCTFTATGMISSLKKSHLFLIVACSLLVIVGIHKQLSEGENMAQQTYIHVDLNISQHDSIFNTCELIVFNHLDPELLEFHYPGYNPKNGCIPYEPITVLHDAKVNVTEKAKGYTCKARCLYNKRDAEYMADPWISVPSEKKFECDIVETDCDPPTLYGSKESYIHSQIYEKRALPRTIEFLKNEFDAVQMEFLNKVGSNTRPNAFPLFFGKLISFGR